MNHLQFGVGFGTMAVTWNSRGQLSRMDWFETEAPSPQTSTLEGHIPPAVLNLLANLRAYFGEGRPIEKFDWEWLDTRGWSEFQRKVYQVLVQIPHGETRTYAWVARKAATGATRAVGQALRRNPLPILIPCHRVVGAQALGGFMGMTDPGLPELKLKKCLIDLENGYLNPVFSFLPPIITVTGG